MKLNTDNKQRLSAGIAFILEFYKMLMGTFLIAFIPQDCGGSVCSLADNVLNSNWLYMFGNISNLVSFFILLYFYFIELKRENWSITYLDIDHNKSHNNLDEEVEGYPLIKKDLLNINHKYLNATKVSIVTLIINFAISFTTIGFNMMGMNSLNAMISFLLLIAMKMNVAFGVAKKSVKKDRIYSAYLKLPEIYNTIDVDHDNIEGNENTQDSNDTETNNTETNNTETNNTETNEDSSSEKTNDVIDVIADNTSVVITMTTTTD